MSTTPIFYLRVRSQGCTADIELNDAPMFSVVREHAQEAVPTISEWVIDGENQLVVRLHAIADSPWIRVALCQARIGDVPEPDAELELIVIEWPPLPIPPVEGALPVEVEPPSLPEPIVLAEVGVAAHPWGRWSWEDAPPFPLDARTTEVVLAYVRDLHAALAAGSVDVLLAESQIKFDEVAPVYDMQPADAHERIRHAWQGLTSHADWQLAPLDETNLELRLRCDGRLVEPTTSDGQPLLRQAMPIDDEIWGLSIFIARTHREYTAGRLAIVR
ncbi:hypothetical protein ACNOYE_35985 [Nannocystaceae bacterium ST9]